MAQSVRRPAALRSKSPATIPSRHTTFSASLQSFQAGYGAQPATYRMNAEGIYPEDKAAVAWRWPLTIT